MTTDEGGLALQPQPMGLVVNQIDLELVFRHGDMYNMLVFIEQEIFFVEELE